MSVPIYPSDGVGAGPTNFLVRAPMSPVAPSLKIPLDRHRHARRRLVSRAPAAEPSLPSPFPGSHWPPPPSLATQQQLLQLQEVQRQGEEENRSQKALRDQMQLDAQAQLVEAHARWNREYQAVDEKWKEEFRNFQLAQNASEQAASEQRAAHTEEQQAADLANSIRWEGLQRTLRSTEEALIATDAHNLAAAELQKVASAELQDMVQQRDRYQLQEAQLRHAVPGHTERFKQRQVEIMKLRSQARVAGGYSGVPLRCKSRTGAP